MVTHASDFIPLPWRQSHATLRCNQCGEAVYWATADFLEAEKGANKFVLEHRCELLRKVKDEMKQYRETHPPMSFEEECKVYNEIMKNQTYL